MPKITLDEFCAHWVEGKYIKRMPNRLERNVFDFATMAGAYAKQQFQASFSSGGFCGKKWAPRTSRWGKRFTHPVLNDTGTLAGSIEGEAGRSGYLKRHGRYTNMRKGAYYWIHTTEKRHPIPGKRGEYKRKKAPVGYAAIHNTDPKFGLFTVNQHSRRRPEHRQFIGFSPKIDDHIATNFASKIFEGFPGV